jgi:cytoskeletal protein CcmA (bactofilin family)
MVFRRDEDADRPGASLRHAAEDTGRTGEGEQFTPVNRGEFYAHLPGAQPAFEQAGPAALSGQVSVIAADATWTGTLVTNGSVHVLGAMTGDRIEAERLEVAHGATVEATVVVGTCSISGVVDGTIECRDRLAVTGSGVVRGSIVAGTLTVDEGAVIVGRLRMRDSYHVDPNDTTVSGNPSEG